MCSLGSVGGQSVPASHGQSHLPPDPALEEAGGGGAAEEGGELQWKTKACGDWARGQGASSWEGALASELPTSHAPQGLCGLPPHDGCSAS